jgi:DNA-binding XRE family transcriptional regulator/membrane protein YdbS with pleckstrin-like domain
LEKNLEQSNHTGQIEQVFVIKNVIKTILFTMFVAFWVSLMAYFIIREESATKAVEPTHWGYILLIDALIVGIPTIIVMIWATLYVNSFEYEFTNQFIYVKSGVLTKNRVSIPFSRVQNINVTQGILDRLFNIHSIKIETAGSSGMNPNNGMMRPEGYIPAIKDPSKIEQLIFKYIHKYTQDAPKSIEGRVFENNNIVFDEFIAYILGKITEGDNLKTNIKDLRKKANMSQAALADEIGVSRQTIVYMEQGKYVPSLTIAMLIAKVFKISIEEIFTLDDSDYKKKKGTQ